MKQYTLSKDRIMVVKKTQGQHTVIAKAERFLSNHANKPNYVTYYVDLQFYANHGLIV